MTEVKWYFVREMSNGDIIRLACKDQYDAINTMIGTGRRYALDNAIFVSRSLVTFRHIYVTYGTEEEDDSIAKGSPVVASIVIDSCIKVNLPIDYACLWAADDLREGCLTAYRYALTGKEEANVWLWTNGDVSVTRGYIPRENPSGDEDAEVYPFWEYDGTNFDPLDLMGDPQYTFECVFRCYPEEADRAYREYLDQCEDLELRPDDWDFVMYVQENNSGLWRDLCDLVVACDIDDLDLDAVYREGCRRIDRDVQDRTTSNLYYATADEVEAVGGLPQWYEDIAYDV